MSPSCLRRPCHCHRHSHRCRRCRRRHCHRCQQRRGIVAKIGIVSTKRGAVVKRGIVGFARRAWCCRREAWRRRRALHCRRAWIRCQAWCCRRASQSLVSLSPSVRQAVWHRHQDWRCHPSVALLPPIMRRAVWRHCQAAWHCCQAAWRRCLSLALSSLLLPSTTGGQQNNVSWVLDLGLGVTRRENKHGQLGLSLAFQSHHFPVHSYELFAI